MENAARQGHRPPESEEATYLDLNRRGFTDENRLD